MPSDIPRLRYILPKLSKGNYNTLMKLLDESLVSDAAKFRRHVIHHYYQYGWKSAVSAFNISRGTLYNWKKAYETSGKKLTSLVPRSTRPRHLREMTIDPTMEVFIKTLRQKYGNVSKYKIKIFLDEYAREIGVDSYSTTKIGKVIKRRNYFFEGKTKLKRKRKPLTSRVRFAPKEKVPGYIEMDSITLYVVDVRYYFITAIDIVTRFAWCKLTTSLSSKQATLALADFIGKYEYLPRAVQTDNGSEFMGEFDMYLEKKGVKHEFIYPRSPRINGVVERFNRTIQEEFIQRQAHIIYNTNQFNLKLTNYLIWYNTKRPHHSLNLDTPLNCLKKYT